MSAFFSSFAGSVTLVLGSLTSITIGAALAKGLFTVADPAGVTVARIGLGALFLCLAWRPWRFTISAAEWRKIALYGVCLGAMNLMFYFAISRLPLGLAIAIEFIGPLSVAIFYSRRALDFLWALLAALGIFLVLPLHEVAVGIDPVGVAYALGAAAAWGLYIVNGKRAGTAIHPGLVTALGMTIGFVAIVPFGVRQVAPLFADVRMIAIVAAVGLLSSAIPYSLETIALKRLPEKYFGLLMSLEPALGALFAFLILRESLTPVQGVAIASIIAASVGSSYTNRGSVT